MLIAVQLRLGNAWVLNYGSPEELIADNSGFITFKLFIDVCKLMLMKNNITNDVAPAK